VTKLRVGRRGNGTQFRGQVEMFLFCGPLSTVHGTLSDDSSPSSADAESAWSYTYFCFSLGLHGEVLN
jgi:hypothetical protein